MESYPDDVQLFGHLDVCRGLMLSLDVETKAFVGSTALGSQLIKVIIN